MKIFQLIHSVAVVIAVQFCASAYGDIVDDSSKSPIDAIQLATTYAQDKPNADTQYRDRQITIKGIVCKIDKGFDTANKALASIYLKTGPGLPSVKIELGNIDKALTQAGKERKNSVNVYGSFIDNNTKTQVNVRLVNNVMEARIGTIRTVSIHSAGHSSTNTDRQNSEWMPIVKCGDSVIITGVCKGKLIDIVISDASL